MTRECDTVVIGSGAGGAVVAATLAEAGEHVIVLEEGPRSRLPLDRRPSEAIRHLWREAGMGVAIGISGPSINITQGRCLGGSSTLTGGVCFRTPEHVLDEWAHDLECDDLEPKAMERWFETVERDCHVEDVPVHMRSRSTKLFIEGGEKLGLLFHSMRRNTKGCNGCGRCNFGCPHGAKMSVDLTYLPRATRAGAEIVTDCLVDRITIENQRATAIRGTMTDGTDVDIRVRKRVFVCAGAMHTPLVLQRSGIRSPALGRNLTLHPSFRVAALFAEPVRGWEGALQSAYSSSYEEDGMILNSVFIPNGVLAAALPGFGKKHAEYREKIANFALFGGMLHDDGGGRVWRNPFGREPFVTYRMSKRDRARIPVLLERMAKIFFAAGAKKVFLPVFGVPPIDHPDAIADLELEKVRGSSLECSSQHPLGSCHMGKSPRDSVVDAFGRTWQVPNVLVADGSILPTSLGVNPQLTIMAMAKRIAQTAIS